MTIRKAVSSDISKLYSIEKELFNAQNFPLSRSSFYYHVQHNSLYVAEMDGDIVAYILVLIKRRDAKLYSIGVLDAFRGNKIAEKLLKHISCELISLGFERMLLEVRTDNIAAIALYKKIGFSLVKTLNAFYKDGCDAYLMELTYPLEQSKIKTTSQIKVMQ